DAAALGGIRGAAARAGGAVDLRARRSVPVRARPLRLRARLRARRRREPRSDSRSAAALLVSLLPARGLGDDLRAPAARPAGPLDQCPRIFAISGPATCGGIWA